MVSFDFGADRLFQGATVMTSLSLWTWLKPRSRQRRRPDRVAQARFLPRLETLEDRWLPSTSPLTVVNNLDSGAGSLRAAVAAASSGDEIVFAKSVHAITLSTELVINKNLDIEGPGPVNLTISGNNACRVFDIQGGANVTIAGLTFANGRVVDDKGGGVANEAGSTLSLLNDTFTANTAYGIGGGLWNAIGATVNVCNTNFVGNHALGSLTFSYLAEGFMPGDGTTEGGGMDNDGTATVWDCTFKDNQAQGATGGAADGAHAGGLNSDGNVTVRYCTFTGNQAIGGAGSTGAPGSDGGAGGQAEGGAIAIGTPLTVADVSYCDFTDNSSQGGAGGTGGAGANGGRGGVGAAGALSLADANLTLENSTFECNQAIGGAGGTGGVGGKGGNGGIGRGGAFVHTVTFGTSTPLSNLSNDSMSDNQAIGGAGGTGGVGGNGGDGGSGQGGAIRALLGTINISHSRLMDNEATGGAGGAAGAGGSFGGNGGNGQGGGLLTTFGVTANVSYTTFLRNEAEGGAGTSGGNGGNGLGGACYNDGLSFFGMPSLTLDHCQVLLNEAEGGTAGSGGSAGVGVGGGVYNLGTFFDLATVIDVNEASTSNDNIFT
jgi:hypothetical protein